MPRTLHEATYLSYSRMNRSVYRCSTRRHDWRTDDYRCLGADAHHRR